MACESDEADLSREFSPIRFRKMTQRRLEPLFGGLSFMP
jgi:hypothetical protein